MHQVLLGVDILGLHCHCIEYVLLQCIVWLDIPLHILVLYRCFRFTSFKIPKYSEGVVILSDVDLNCRRLSLSRNDTKVKDETK